MNKKYLLFIVAGIILLFGMNRCAVSCTYQNKYRHQVELTDSLYKQIQKLKNDTAILRNDTAMLRQNNKTLENSNTKLIETSSNKKEVHYHYK